MSISDFKFSVQHQDMNTRARAGHFTTAHGRTMTPAFMPVATHAVLRGHMTESLAEIGYQTILGNTYHLLLRPGDEVFKKAGGIHQFMRWNGSVLTDSGGYQIFSLSDYLKLDEEGAEFRSYVDGKKILLTPERSIEMQRAINSDIMMALDQCIPALSDKPTAKAALHLTHRWAKRSLAARGDSAQALFGIVQGACFPELRKLSAEQITSLPFDGFAIGGLAVGEEKSQRDEMIDYTAALLPKDRPRYLMGVGTPIDILEAVSRGIDMFDCILPTALAQQGVCFSSLGKMNLRRGVYRLDQEPLDPTCTCHTCKNYSRSYLHHLINIGEFVGATLIGFHNLTFYFTLMKKMREAILANSFQDFYREQREVLAVPDPQYPANHPKRKSKPAPEPCGNYEIVKQGAIASIRHIQSGEVMHSVSDPSAEAELLYVGQSKLRQRITARSEEPLVVWDVGLGAGFNAMALIKAVEECAKHEKVAAIKLISFENDLDSLKLALRNPNLFSHTHHEAPHALLRNGSWISEDYELEWSLKHGDFLQTAPFAPSPEFIFFDPFSYKTDSELWTLKSFSLVKSLSHPGVTKLFTYTASTAVRTAMLAAGFYVARGVAVPPKDETTIAICPPAGLEFPLLDSEWLSRWERSQNRYPVDISGQQRSDFDNLIRHHPQFA